MKSLLLALVVAACAANPVKTAYEAPPEDRPELVAFALHNSYVIVAERAATIAEDSTTPRAVRQALITLHENASPVAKQLRQAAAEYEQVRDAIKAGQSTPDKLAIAFAELDRLITAFSPRLNALSSEVQEVSQ